MSIQEIDGPFAKRVAEIVSRFLTVRVSGEWEITVPKDYALVPAATGAHFGVEVEVIQRIAEPPLFLYDLEGSRRAFMLRSTSDQTFRELNAEWGLWDVALLPEEANWIFLASRDDFWILIARLPVAQQFFPDLSAAIDEFRRFLREYGNAPGRLSRATGVEWQVTPGETITL